MRRSVQFLGTVILVAIVASFGIHLIEEVQIVISHTLSEETEEKVSIVIDPGHGGEDPGKVGVNGALEKDINLTVGLMVRDILEEKGYEITMTREEDVSMLGEETFSKVGDLSARVELMNAVQPELVVSVHQNSYTSESIRGAQVFYYTYSTEGEALAESIQTELWQIDPDNARQIKANDSYYILSRTEVPMVIVECGFLSNEEEAELLATESYQKEIANAIVVGIEQYLEE